MNLTSFAVAVIFLSYCKMELNLFQDRKVTPSTKFDNPRQKVADEREVKSDRNGPEKFNSPVESETSSYESEAEPKYKYRSERLALRQAQTRSRKDHRRSRHKKPSPEVEVMAQRTCRTRAVVSYQFKEFDELISNAIEDDKPCKKEKPPGKYLSFCKFSTLAD